MRRPGRFWLYSADHWEPDHPLLPYLGGDEYGRRTIVQRITPSRYLVVAFGRRHPEMEG